MTRESIVHWFDRAADSYSQTSAIECSNRRFTYGELYERSNRLANLLISCGATRGSIVAIVVEDRMEIIMAMIATLKAGCAFAPLDPAMPDKRLERMVSELTPECFVVEARTCARLAKIRLPRNDRRRRSDRRYETGFGWALKRIKIVSFSAVHAPC